jgi:hypothetical protein
MISFLLESKVREVKDRIPYFKRSGLPYEPKAKDWLKYWEEEDWRFLGTEDFVLEYGRYWSPQKLPSGYKLMKLGLCGQNSSRLALKNHDITYVEGFAEPYNWYGRQLYLGHSWVVDPAGRVIDVTWPEGGKEYFGVPFETDFLRKIGKGKPVNTLLDRWREGFPLLRKLGTAPAKWYSKRFVGPHGLKTSRRRAIR